MEENNSANNNQSTIQDSPSTEPAIQNLTPQKHESKLIPIVIILGLLLVSGASAIVLFYNYFLSTPNVLNRMLNETGKISKEEIFTKLTKNSWCTDVINDPRNSETWKKEFKSDNTYSSQFSSDLISEPTMGTWNLEKSDHGYWILISDSRYIIAFNENNLAMYPENTDFSTIAGINYYKDCKQNHGSTSQ